MCLNLGLESRCDICTETYSDHRPPATIACGHIYCINCFRNIHPRICPVCRRAFRSQDILKLHVDSESEDVCKLQATLDTIGAGGVDEAELFDFIIEARTFLGKQQSSDSYKSVRTSLKLVWCTASQMTEKTELKEKLTEEFALKLEAERKVHDSAVNLYIAEKNLIQKKAEEAERKNLEQLRVTSAAYAGLMQKYEKLVDEWETLREELRHVEAERASHPRDSDPLVGFPQDVGRIMSKNPEDHRDVLEGSADFFSPIFDPATAEKILRLNPCGSSGHPSQCPCEPITRGQSGSLSSDMSSSGPPTPPSFDNPSRPSGIALAAPFSNAFEETKPEPRMNQSARSSQRKNSKKSHRNPLPSTGKAKATPSVNAATAMSVGPELVPELQPSALSSRLSVLLTDPSPGPSVKTISGRDSIHAGSSSAQTFHSARTNQNGNVPSRTSRSTVPGGSSTNIGSTQRSAPVNMPPRSSTANNASHGAAIRPSASPSNWQSSSVSGQGVQSSSASDAARRGQGKQQAPQEQTYAQYVHPQFGNSSSASGYGSSVPVPIPGNRKNTPIRT